MLPKPKRIRDKAALREARLPYCEACGQSIPEGIGVHHICHKSQGGPDIPENLVMLCDTCHFCKAHNARYSQDYLFGIVAQREGKTTEEIQSIVNQVRGNIIRW